MTPLFRFFDAQPISHQHTDHPTFGDSIAPNHTPRALVLSQTLVEIPPPLVITN